MTRYITTVSIALIASFGFLCASASADSFMLDYGNVAASGQQMTITRLPIVKNNGEVVYKDVTIRFGVRKRKLFVKKGYPKTKSVAAIDNGKLVAGQFYLNNTNYVFDMIGPGVGPNGRSLWTLVGVNNSAELVFYGGPVKGHPLQERLNDAGITSSPYTFGESSEDGALVGHFFDGCLVSAHMVSGNIMLNSHSSFSCDADFENPERTLTLRQCPAGGCD